MVQKGDGVCTEKETWASWTKPFTMIHYGSIKAREHCVHLSTFWSTQISSWSTLWGILWHFIELILWVSMITISRSKRTLRSSWQQNFYKLNGLPPIALEEWANWESMSSSGEKVFENAKQVCRITCYIVWCFKSV